MERKREAELAQAEQKALSMREGMFFTQVFRGEALNNVRSVVSYKKREIIGQQETYVFGNAYNRVFNLYGLRRTGKTTMMKQILAEMDEEQFAKEFCRV